jgi:hypothetical protein
MDHIKRKNEIEQLTQKELMAHLIRLQESSDIVTEFAATIAENPRQTSYVSLQRTSLITREMQRGRKAEKC